MPAITPTLAINATSVPAPAPLPTLASPQAVLAGSASPVLAPEITLAADMSWAAKSNAAAAMMEAVARTMTGVVSGLTLSAGVGLNIAVADGVGLCGGVLEGKTLPALTLPSSTSAWVWLKTDGTLTYTTGTTALATPGLMLGRVTTDASAVTAIDYSGVLYILGGMMWRTTGDAGAPGDSPAATTRLWTKTAGGTYLWNGAAHVAL